MLILFQFLCRYVFFLYLITSLFGYVFYATPSPSNLGHQAAYCTYYCEDHGCTHGLKLARFYPLVQRQVAVLYALPGAYKQANLMAYLVVLPLLIVGGLSVLFGRNRPRRPVRWWYWLILLIGALGLGIWALPASQHRLFYGAVNVCLWVARQLGLSLYDTYILIFALVGPALLVLLVVTAVGRLCWQGLTQQKNR